MAGDGPGKGGAAATDKWAMEYVHHCLFCNWHREAASPTVLAPACERCGCTLTAAHAADWHRSEPVEAILAPAAQGRFVQLVVLAGSLLLCLGAARTGYSQGGFAVAVAAVGVAGLTAIAAGAASRQAIESSSAPNGR